MLGTILHSELEKFYDPNLLVGNETADDAAVYDLGNGTAIISTTDFFMPIVDDPFDFGRIAATNAISDIFAMGGKPIMGIAILGFPTNVLPAEVAQKIVDGGRFACHQAGIKLYMTKPLGIGILTTAEKKGKLKPEHQGLATAAMCQMNSIGSQFSQVDGVTAMTDVTGFGLLGHLIEICEGSNLSAVVFADKIKTLDGVKDYIAQGCVPGGTGRNFESYGHKVGALTEEQKAILCDPQTSGGLLVAVEPNSVQAVIEIAKDTGIDLYEVGELNPKSESDVVVEIA